MENNKPAEVRVVDISIPFLSMVELLVRLALAAVPALVILAITLTILVGIFMAVFQ